MLLPSGATRRLLSILLLAATAAASPALGQNLSDRRAVTPVTEANYRLAGRFSPPRMSKLVYSTSVNPRWIEGSERFWYEWNTAAGKVFTIVDPVAGTKRLLFDNDKLAAELIAAIPDHILYTWIAMAILVAVSFVASRRVQLVPTGSQNFMEIVLEQ
jgi:hypothetical protein